MAKRVKQADGSYCYTENCRIHDRSALEATGHQAAVIDAAKQVQSQERETIISTLDSFGKKGSEKIADSLLAKSYAYDGTANHVAQFYGNEYGGKSASYNAMEPFVLQDALRANKVIKQGTTVILNETGERGTISEGDSRFGEVRFNPDNMHSKNYFKWLKPADMTPLRYSTFDSARVQFLSLKNDEQLPHAMVGKMFDEERSAENVNGQFNRGMNKDADREEVEEAYKEIANRWMTANPNGGNVTRARISRYIVEESKKDYGHLKPASANAVKTGLENLGRYLDSSRIE